MMKNEYIKVKSLIIIQNNIKTKLLKIKKNNKNISITFCELYNLIENIQNNYEKNIITQINYNNKLNEINKIYLKLLKFLKN